LKLEKLAGFDTFASTIEQPGNARVGSFILIEAFGGKRRGQETHCCLSVLLFFLPEELDFQGSVIVIHRNLFKGKCPLVLRGVCVAR
jgi:hypothetical protein